MANTKQAKKRAEQSERKKARNRAVKSETRKSVKALRSAVTAEPAKAKEMLPETVSQLDIAVRKGVLHKKTASRLKSRVARAVNKSASPAA
ncbi:MAG: 30S ribosomal protein S20 [Acidobacteria bacterium]|nr:30S ribosomal protein S20 [Acidobacteriota bacterium]